MPSWRAIGRILVVVFAIGYPFVVYGVLMHHGPRAVALLVALVLGPGLALRVRGQGLRAALSGPSAGVAAAIVLAGAAFALREADLTLFVPAVMNAALGAVFGASLAARRPIVERFARMQHPDLAPAEVRWCRLWTWIWVGFFGFNVAAVAALALLAPVEWWVAYTGGVAYALMGTLFAVEYLVRKRRFGRFDDHLLDRALAQVLARGDAS